MCSLVVDSDGLNT